MATAMPAAKGLGPGDQSIVPDEGEIFFERKVMQCHSYQLSRSNSHDLFLANLVRCQFIANSIYVVTFRDIEMH